MVQGIGVGGLSALAQIVMAAMISPRERGRYSGYLGATFAVATVGGPLLGGVITDTSWLGWRWCFYVGVPFAIIALIVLQKTLHLPVVKRDVKVDWARRVLHHRGGLAAAGLGHLRRRQVRLGVLADATRWSAARSCSACSSCSSSRKAREPIIPLRLFRNRTITLASLASLFVGVAMFTGTVFFSQYFQLARDKSPTMSGVMTIPMIGGLFVSSTVSGQFITRTGRWKGWLVSGGVLVTAGLGLLGTIRYDTDYWKIAVFMALLGLGIGMMMQNLVLSTQNQVAPSDLGSASSTVTFFRSLGGAVGVSALGAVMAHRITHYVKDGLAGLGPKYARRCASGSGSGSIPDMDKLPAPLRTVMESAYGHGIARRLPDRRRPSPCRLPDHPVHQGGPAARRQRPGPGGSAGARRRRPRRHRLRLRLRRRRRRAGGRGEGPRGGRATLSLRPAPTGPDRPRPATAAAEAVAPRAAEPRAAAPLCRRHRE